MFVSAVVQTPEATKSRLLAAAGDLFAEKGFHGTKVRDIAARAGVNVAAGNYHFGSKKELYLEVVRAQFARMHERIAKMGAALEPVDLGELGRPELLRLLRVRLEVMLEMLMGTGGDDVHARLMMREMAEPSEALTTIVREMAQPLVEETRQIIGHLRPELDRGQVERISLSVAGQIHFYRFMMPALLEMLGMRSYSRAFLGEVVEHVFEFSLGGMDRLAAGRRKGRR
jgi:TetR/AcrR family transcriptional regulator, regulator of cefoperazone and chloramphenicol sensitivity